MIDMTLMEKEARESPKVIAEQIKRNQGIFLELSKHLKKTPPQFAVTIARGSSDHAATFAKYLFETRLGIVTSSAAPSVLTLYKANLSFKGALAVGLSQSGESPDICEVMAKARKAGAVTVSFVNHPESYLARESEFIAPLYAGEEKAVAATKSYIATLSAIIHLTAILSDDKELLESLYELPEALEKAVSADWSRAVEIFRDVQDTLVIARGYCFPIAEEAALKFKETSSIHAEAFSGAEVLHGPFALIKKDYPVLIFTEDDISLQGIVELTKKMKKLGARTIFSCPEGRIPKETLDEISYLTLPLTEGVHKLCDPLIIIQAFYIMAARLAVRRGSNPDAPVNLKKITETI